MIDIPLNLAFNLAKDTVRLGRRAKKLRDEARETGVLVCESLQWSVDQLGFDPEVSADLTKAIATELAQTPLSAVDRPAGWRKMMLKKLRRGIPEASLLSGAPFSERMERWLIRCMEGELVRQSIAAIDPPAALDLEQVAEGFSVAFHGHLVENPSTFNEELIRELQSSDAARQWMEEKRRRFEGGVVGAATAGVGAYGVAQAVNIHDPLALAAAVAGATGISGLAWLGSLSRPQVTAPKRAARRIALGWVVDLLRSLGVDGATESIRDLRSIVARPEHWRHGWDAVHGSELLGDLGGRVLGVAAEAQDEQLSVAIRRVEDALVRAGRKETTALADALMELLDAVAADGAIPEAESRPQMRSVTSLQVGR